MIIIYLIHMYMLKKKLIKSRLDIKNIFDSATGNVKHYPPSNREWYDSVYTYNKNTIKLLPIANKLIVKLVKNYFNFYSIKLERKIKFPKLRKWMRRLSSTRILVSKAELKHTNDRLIISVYVYNRQKVYYINKLKRLYGGLKLKNLKTKLKFRHIKIMLNKFTSLLYVKKNVLINNLQINKILFKGYEYNNMIQYVKICLNQEMLYLYILQTMLVNKLKFKKIYLFILNNLIRNFYNKKIEFNFVNQKYFYLNGDILLQILAIKLRKRKNVIKVLTTAINSIDRFNLTKLQILRGANIKYLLEHKSSQNIILNSNINNKLKEYLFFNKEKLIFYDSNKKKEVYAQVGLEHAVINSLKYKNLTGVRLEAAGRLTRRMTASRSIYKVVYAGNIRNLDSSFLGHSAKILKGNLKSSLQSSKIQSKIRIGSFGLKGWINGI